MNNILSNPILPCRLSDFMETYFDSKWQVHGMRLCKDSYREAPPWATLWLWPGCVCFFEAQIELCTLCSSSKIPFNRVYWIMGMDKISNEVGLCPFLTLQQKFHFYCIPSRITKWSRYIFEVQSLGTSCSLRLYSLLWNDQEIADPKNVFWLE